MRQLRIALYVLGAMVLIALTEMGRTAVNPSYDYRELTAPKSLHQLSLEARGGPDDRNRTLLLSAGLFAVGLLSFGGMLFAMSSGRKFGRRMGRKRRRTVGSYTADAARRLPPDLPATPCGGVP